MAHGAADGIDVFISRDNGYRDIGKFFTHRDQAKQVLAARHVQVQQQQIGFMVALEITNRAIQIHRLHDNGIRIILFQYFEKRVAK